MKTDSRSSWPGKTVSPSVALVQLGILLILTALAFRQEIRVVLAGASGFSEWSHAAAFPVLAVALVYRRRADFRGALTGGSPLGIGLMLLGFSAWFVSYALGVFGYAGMLGMAVFLAGVVVFVAGWGVARLALPLFLMLWLCLPLSERSVERFTIAAQRISVSAAALGLKALPGVEVGVKGTILTYTRGEERGDIGLAEQRFGVRLVPACVMLWLYLVFSRTRPVWRVFLLMLACPLMVFVANLARMTAWAVASIYGGYDVISNVPRNVSLLSALVATWACFVISNGLLAQLGRLERFLVVEDAEGPDETPLAGPEVSRTGAHP